MEANELQIGDWVQVPSLIDDVEHYNAWCKVRQLRDCDLDVIDFKELKYNEIVPIPLTAEILVKYGFKYSMPHNDWTNADCNFYLYEGGNGYRVQNTDIKLDYVHQLQHLLRLCNIEKEIEL